MIQHGLILKHLPYAPGDIVQYNNIGREFLQYKNENGINFVYNTSTPMKPLEPGFCWLFVGLASNLGRDYDSIYLKLLGLETIYVRVFFLTSLSGIKSLNSMPTFFTKINV